MRRIWIGLGGLVLLGCASWLAWEWAAYVLMGVRNPVADWVLRNVPACQDSRLHELRYRISSVTPCARTSWGSPGVSVHITMPQSGGYGPPCGGMFSGYWGTNTIFDFVELPVWGELTYRTCEPYGFGTYGVGCDPEVRVWIDGIPAPASGMIGPRELGVIDGIARGVLRVDLFGCAAAVLLGIGYGIFRLVRRIRRRSVDGGEAA